MRLMDFMAGPAGRAIRVVAGIALIAVGLITGGSGGVVLAVVGLVPLAAGAFGFCLLGPLFGVSLHHRPPSASAH
jgi:hypothetical protein